MRRNVTSSRPKDNQETTWRVDSTSCYAISFELTVYNPIKSAGKALYCLTDRGKESVCVPDYP